MLITRMSGSGIKGAGFDLCPKPVTIITGPNWSNKTVIVLGLELLLLGYSPAHGKKPGAIMELSSGEPIDVWMDVDGEPAIHRCWSWTGDGATAGKPLDSLKVPPVLFDLGEVFSLSKDKRLAYYFKMCNADAAISWEQMTATIKTVKIDEPNEETELAINELVALANEQDGGNIQERLENYLKALDDERKRLNKEVEDHAGLARTLVRQSDAEIAAPLTGAQDRFNAAQRRANEARAGLDEANRDAAVLIEKKESLRQMEAANSGAADIDLARLETQQRINQLCEERGKALGMDELGAQLLEMTGVHSRLEAELKALRDRTTVILERADAIQGELNPDWAGSLDHTELEAEIARAELSLAQLQEEMEKFDVPTLQSSAGELSSQEAGLKAENKMRAAAFTQLQANSEKFQARIEKIEKAEACPTCKTTGTEWKATLLVEARAELEAAQAAQNENLEARGKADVELATIAQSIIEINENLNASREAELLFRACVEKIDGLKARRDAEVAANAEYQKLSGEFDALESAHAELQEQIQQKAAEFEASGNALEEKRKVHAAACGLRDALEKARANMATLEAKQREHAAAVTRMDDLRGEIAAINEASLNTALEAAMKEHDRAQLELTEATSVLQKATADHGVALAQRQSLVDRDKATAKLTVVKAALAALSAFQKKAIADAFKPLLEVINQFTCGILREPLAFHDAELGYWRDGHFVKRTTFSGSEEALAMVALSVALASQCKAALKVVILDEMGRFDRKVIRPAIIKRMEELWCTGVIDHFFGVDPDTEFYEQYAGRENVLVHCVG